MKYKIVSLIISIFLLSCSKKSDQIGQGETSEAVKSPKQVVQHFYMNGQKGRKLHIKEMRIEGIPLVEIQIIPSGYPNNHPVEVGAIDPIDHLELADLDANGESELYIFTKEIGTEKKGNFYVFAPLKGEKFVQVEMEFLDPKEYLKGGKLEGYLGHDQYTLEQDKIIRSYPIYDINDTTVKATDRQRKVVYKLKNQQIKMISSHR